MRLNLLLEGLSENLFHITNLDKALSVLKDNKYPLKSLKNSNARIKHKINKKYPYYLSTARSMNSGFITSVIREQYTIFVAFELDGRKLANNFTGIPMEYFSSTYKERETMGNNLFDLMKMGGDKDDPSAKFKYFELEDRLTSSKPAIENFNKYIKAMHVLIKYFDLEDAESVGKQIRDVNKDIPTYIYKTRNDFIFLRRSKAERV